MKDPVVVGYQVERETKTNFDAIARNAGMSGAAFLDLVMKRVHDVDLTDQGIPSWLPEKDRSGELPIESP